jgi:ribosomal protein L29
MTKNELKNQASDQLRASLNEQRTKLAQLREDLTLNKLSDTSQIAQVRKQIARTLTALRKAK